MQAQRAQDAQLLAAGEELAQTLIDVNNYFWNQSVNIPFVSEYDISEMVREALAAYEAAKKAVGR